MDQVQDVVYCIQKCPIGGAFRVHRFDCQANAQIGGLGQQFFQGVFQQPAGMIVGMMGAGAAIDE